MTAISVASYRGRRALKHGLRARLPHIYPDGGSIYPGTVETAAITSAITAVVTTAEADRAHSVALIQMRIYAGSTGYPGDREV